MKQLALLLCIAIFAVQGVRASTREYTSVLKLKSLIAKRDFLGTRIFIRKNFQKIKDPSEWMQFRIEVMRASDRIGFDMIYALDRRPVVGLSSGSMNINEARNASEALLIGGRFEEAFATFQKIAQELRRLKEISVEPDQTFAIDFLMPFVMHSMARSLYGAQRFDEAYLVLRWIPANYAKIRQVQFEKMWAAFRGGRVDHALGAIASQSSAYFSSFLSPESYLVQTYLYKRLCRENDYQSVIQSMKSYVDALKSGLYSFEDYARTDLETLVLWNLIKQPIESATSVPTSELKAERDRIKNVLEKAFTEHKARSFEEMQRALAYVNLTIRSGSGTLLRPIEKLPDRQALFGLGLEIWPAHAQEDWIDEIGAHRFIGESLCKAGS